MTIPFCVLICLLCQKQREASNETRKVLPYNCKSIDRCFMQKWLNIVTKTNMSHFTKACFLVQEQTICFGAKYCCRSNVSPCDGGFLFLFCSVLHPNIHQFILHFVMDCCEEFPFLPHLCGISLSIICSFSKNYKLQAPLELFCLCSSILLMCVFLYICVLHFVS